MCLSFCSPGGGGSSVLWGRGDLWRGRTHPRPCRDTVNQRSVRILVECILFTNLFLCNVSFAVTINEPLDTILTSVAKVFGLPVHAVVEVCLAHERGQDLLDFLHGPDPSYHPEVILLHDVEVGQRVHHIIHLLFRYVPPLPAFISLLKQDNYFE